MEAYPLLVSSCETTQVLGLDSEGVLYNNHHHHHHESYVLNGSGSSSSNHLNSSLSASQSSLPPPPAPADLDDMMMLNNAAAYGHNHYNHAAATAETNHNSHYYAPVGQMAMHSGNNNDGCAVDFPDGGEPDTVSIRNALVLVRYVTLAAVGVKVALLVLCMLRNPLNVTARMSVPHPRPSQVCGVHCKLTLSH